MARKSQNEAVVTLSTTGGTVAASGMTRLNSTVACAYTLEPPILGKRIVIVKTAASTADITVTCSTAKGAATVDGTNSILTFDGANEAIEMIGETSTRWRILENIGTVGTSAP